MSLAETPDLVLMARLYRKHDAPKLMAYLNKLAPGVAAGLKALDPDEISFLRWKLLPETLILSVPEIEQALHEEGGVDRLLDTDLSGLASKLPPGIHSRNFPTHVRVYLKWLALCDAVHRTSSQIRRENQEQENERRRLAHEQHRQKAEQQRQEAERQRADAEQRREDKLRHQANIRLKELIAAGERLAGLDIEAEQNLEPEVIEITGVPSREIESYRLTPEDADALMLFTGAARRCRDREPEEWSEADKAILLQRLERGTAINRAVEKIGRFRNLRDMARQRQTSDEEVYDTWRDIGKELK